MPDPLDATTALPGGQPLLAGRYRFDELVGRGGTAEVWKGWDTALSRVVAIKLVTAPHDASAARAADEAKTLGQLSSGSLVSVFDAGTDPSGRPWVVMEFVDGQTLADMMRRGPLPVARINEVGLAVAEGLTVVHAAGLLHRDVKPANVLIGRDGRVKLTDFGIARLVDSSRVTSTGLMVGTAAYVAPEQVAGETVGPAADVYALGLVLLEALTGVREYDGPPLEAAMARLSRSPHLPASLPPGWAPLLSEMTAREARQRPTAAEVARVLRGMLYGDTRTVAQPVQTTVVAPPPAPYPPPTSALRVEPVPVAPVVATRSRAPLYTFLVVFVLVLAAVGIYFATRSSSPQPVPSVDPGVHQPLNNDLQRFKDRIAVTQDAK